MLRYLILITLLLISTPLHAIDWGDWSSSILTGTDESSALMLGRTANEGHAEVGAHIITRKTAGEYDSALGAYFAHAFELPFLESTVVSEDFKTFVAASAVWDLEASRPAAILSAGILVYPERYISPLLVWRYNVIDDSVPNPVATPGSSLFAGLRIVLK
jgi:hypothetical protein